jgi:hypothetical protein
LRKIRKRRLLCKTGTSPSRFNGDRGQGFHFASPDSFHMRSGVLCKLRGIGVGWPEFAWVILLLLFCGTCFLKRDSTASAPPQGFRDDFPLFLANLLLLLGRYTLFLFLRSSNRCCFCSFHRALVDVAVSTWQYRFSRKETTRHASAFVTRMMWSHSASRICYESVVKCSKSDSWGTYDHAWRRN